MPFSMEKLSVGSPEIFQSLILTGSPRVTVGDTTSEQGTPIFLHDCVHSSACSYAYTIKPIPITSMFKVNKKESDITFIIYSKSKIHIAASHIILVSLFDN